ETGQVSLGFRSAFVSHETTVDHQRTRSPKESGSLVNPKDPPEKETASLSKTGREQRLTTGFKLNRFATNSLERTFLAILLITLSVFTIYRLPAHSSSSLPTNSSAANQPPVIVGWGGVGIGESLSDIQSELQY